MNSRPAPESVVMAVEKRLGAIPGARLVPETCKVCAIPSTPFDCTMFIASRPQNGHERRFFTTELGAARADVPHVYFTKEITGLAAKALAGVMVEGLRAMAQRIHHDPRFKGNVIEISSARILPGLTKMNGSR